MHLRSVRSSAAVRSVLLADCKLGSYELPRRVFTAQKYPVQAPNGSALIVYGHDDGLTFLWRGGRPLRRRRKSLDQQSKLNGNNKQDMDISMTLEDEPTGNPTDDDFEADEDELDPSRPCPAIVDTLEVPLNSAALHISFAPIPPSTKARFAPHHQRQDELDLPAIFTKDAVVAVSCADSSLHLIAVPLVPLPNRSKFQVAEGNRGFQDLIINPPNARKSMKTVPGGISLTWTAELLAENQGQAGHSSTAAEGQSWTLLVASHTSEASGVIRVHVVPIGSANSPTFSEHPAKLLRIEYLPRFAHKVCFKPTLYPSKSHTQLLVTDIGGFVRIYDPVPTGRSLSRRTGISTTHGAWLAAFQAPSDHVKSGPSSGHMSRQTAKLLDAAWALSGTCIVVLLSSGHWGVWDVSGSGIGTERGLLQGQSLMTGYAITGAGVTPFALKGYIGKGSGSKPQSHRVSTGSETDSEPKRLAPMTPNTRKARQEKLFIQQQSPKLAPISSAISGGLSVQPLIARAVDERSDDSLMLWLDTEIFAIPSLRTYWRRAASKSSTAGSQQVDVSMEGTCFGANIAPLSNISTGGEAITNISQMPDSLVARPSVASGALRHQILVSAEHRLIFISPPEEISPAEELDRLFAPLQGSMPTRTGLASTSRVEQDLLAQGELDLGGMDRMLNGMGARRNDLFGPGDALESTNQRKVGFAGDY